MGRQEPNPPTISLGFAVVVLIIAFALPSVVYAQQDPPREGQGERTPYDELLDLEAAEARRTAQAVGQIADRLDEGGEDLLNEVFNFGAAADPNQHLAHIEERRSALHASGATALDEVGLEHLIEGRYQQAAEAFSRSLQAQPNRGAPLLFLGIAQLEQGQWREAAATLGDAEAHDDCQPTAKLLRAWARACVDDPPMDAADEGLRMVRAMASLPEVEFDFARSISGQFHYNESQALYWAQGAAYNLRHERVAELLRADPDPDSPHDSLVVWAAFNAPGQVDTRLQQLITQFPDDPALNSHARWRRAQALGEPEEVRAAWPGVRQWASDQLQRDPGNGMLELMRVMPLYKYEDVVDEFGAYVDTVDHSEPFSAEEIAAMRRAVDAPRFEHPGNATSRAAYELRREVFGPLLTFRGMSQMGYPGSTMRTLARRHANTLEALADAGEMDRAIEAGELLCGVARRVAMMDAHRPMISMMVYNSIESMVASDWIEYGRETDDRRLVRVGVGKYVPTTRVIRAYAELTPVLVMGEVIPVNRLRDGIVALTLALAEPGHPATRELYLQHAQAHVDRSLEELREPDELDQFGYRVVHAMIGLTALREPRALPLIEPLQNDGNLFVAETARWAVLQFEAE